MGNGQLIHQDEYLQILTISWGERPDFLPKIALNTLEGYMEG